MLLFSFTTLLPDSLWPLLLRDIAQCGKLLLIAVVLIEFYTLQIFLSDIQQILANEQIDKFVVIEVTLANDHKISDVTRSLEIQAWIC